MPCPPSPLGKALNKLKLFVLFTPNSSTNQNLQYSYHKEIENVFQSQT